MIPTNQVDQIIFILIVIFSISLLLNFIYIKNYPKKNTKQSKKIPNPKNIASEGGLVFFLLFFLSFFIIVFNNIVEINLYNVPRYYVLFISLFIICILSYVDDKFFVSKKIRFLFQIILSFSSLSSLNLPIFNLLPEKLEILLLVFMWVYVTNITNFIDGLNGMLASNCISFFIGCIIIINHFQIFDNYLLVIILLLLILTISFLVFNFPKPLLFLGDTGSIPLGFLIGYILIYFFSLDIFWPTLFLFCYPITDISITLFDKVFIRKKLPWARLFDYFFLNPVINGQKKHSFVIYNVLFVNILNLLFLKIFLLTGKYILIFIPFILSIILIIYFRNFKKIKS